MAIDPGAKTGIEKQPDIGEQLQGLLDRFSGVSAQERMFFTEQLILLLETGASLHGALKTLHAQCERAPLKAVLATVMNDIAEGSTFSRALARHPEVFDDVYVNLIGASEAGGFMPEVLAELLQMEEKRDKLRNTLMSAFSYPLFLIVFSILVVVFVLVSVFPKFGDMFQTIHDQLPGTTLVFLAMSNLLVNHWPWIVGGLALAGIGFYMALRSEPATAWLDRMKLRIPVLRSLFIEIYLVQSLRVMGLSLSHGVSVPDTLRSCRAVVSNREYRQFIDSIEHNVMEGRRVSLAFEQSDLMPVLVKQMIQTGDESGTLAKVMGKVADFYERELNRRVDMLSKMAEPLMLVIMGIVVGLLVSSLILPIFKLSSAVH